MTHDRAVIEVQYGPGNATRYHLLLIEPAPGDYCRTFVWVNAPGGGRAVRLHVNGCLHVGYLAEKMRYEHVADLLPILRWLGEQGFDTQRD